MSMFIIIMSKSHFNLSDGYRKYYNNPGWTPPVHMKINNGHNSAASCIDWEVKRCLRMFMDWLIGKNLLKRIVEKNWPPKKET